MRVLHRLIALLLIVTMVVEPVLAAPNTMVRAYSRTPLQLSCQALSASLSGAHFSKPFSFLPRFVVIARTKILQSEPSFSFASILISAQNPPEHWSGWGWVAYGSAAAFALFLLVQSVLDHSDRRLFFNGGLKTSDLEGWTKTKPIDTLELSNETIRAREDEILRMVSPASQAFQVYLWCLLQDLGQNVRYSGKGEWIGAAKLYADPGNPSRRLLHVSITQAAVDDQHWWKLKHTHERFVVAGEQALASLQDIQARRRAGILKYYGQGFSLFAQLAAQTPAALQYERLPGSPKMRTDFYVLLPMSDAGSDPSAQPHNTIAPPQVGSTGEFAEVDGAILEAFDLWKSRQMSTDDAAKHIALSMRQFAEPESVTRLKTALDLFQQSSDRELQALSKQLRPYLEPTADHHEMLQVAQRFLFKKAVRDELLYQSDLLNGSDPEWLDGFLESTLNDKIEWVPGKPKRTALDQSIFEERILKGWTPKKTAKHIGKSVGLIGYRTQMIQQRIVARAKARATNMSDPLDDRVDSLPLSPRAIHVLRGGSVRTLRELTQYTERRLLRIPHMRKKWVKEIKEKLALVGLSLAPKQTLKGPAPDTGKLGGWMLLPLAFAAIPAMSLSGFAALSLFLSQDGWRLPFWEGMSHLFDRVREKVETFFSVEDAPRARPGLPQAHGTEPALPHQPPQDEKQLTPDQIISRLEILLDHSFTADSRSLLRRVLNEEPKYVKDLSALNQLGMAVLKWALIEQALHLQPGISVSSLETFKNNAFRDSNRASVLNDWLQFRKVSLGIPEAVAPSLSVALLGILTVEHDAPAASSIVEPYASARVTPSPFQPYGLRPHRVNAMWGDAVLEVLIAAEIFRQRRWFADTERSVGQWRGLLASNAVLGELLVFHPDWMAFGFIPMHAHSQGTLFEAIIAAVYRLAGGVQGQGFLEAEQFLLEYLDYWLEDRDDPDGNMEFFRVWAREAGLKSKTPRPWPLSESRGPLGIAWAKEIAESIHRQLDELAVSLQPDDLAEEVRRLGHFLTKLHRYSETPPSSVARPVAASA